MQPQLGYPTNGSPDFFGAASASTGYSTISSQPSDVGT